jgi:hypothetical protein
LPYSALIEYGLGLRKESCKSTLKWVVEIKLTKNDSVITREQFAAAAVLLLIGCNSFGAKCSCGEPVELKQESSKDSKNVQ